MNSKIKKEKSDYILGSEMNPEASQGTVKGIVGQEWRVRPGFFDVFKDDMGLCNWFTAMNENGDLLMDRIVLRKQLTFVGEIFFYVIILDALEFERPNHLVYERTSPETM